MPAKTKKGSTRNSSGNPEEFRMSLGDHFEELRGRLMRAAIALSITWIIGWFLQPPIYEALNQVIDSVVKDYLKTNPTFKYETVFSDMLQPFMFKLKLSFLIGLCIALPYLVLEIWGFVKPGLKPAEQKPIKYLAPISVVLFALGTFFCWLILPQTFGWCLSFLDEFPQTALFQKAGEMVFFTMKMMLGFGLGFQLPLIVYIVARVGIIAPETLQEYWKHATVFVFVASAVLTPSNDPLSMLMMAVPLTILLMLSIFLVRLTIKGKVVKQDDELDQLDS